MKKGNKILIISGAATAIIIFVIVLIVNAVRQKKYKKMIENAKNKQEKFILTFAPSFKKATKGTPLFTSVKLAQAAVETGWGSNYVNGANNMFGIKATGKPNKYWKGDKILANTKEDYGSGKVSIDDYFRKYKTLEDSIKDHSLLLLTLDRYKPVLDAKTPEEQARQLQICGYATAKNYSSLLISIINQYNLKQFD